MTETVGRRDLVRRLLAGGILVSAELFSGVTSGALASHRAGPGGFSRGRLKAVSAAMVGFVDRREAAGIITALYRHGALAHMEAVGWQDKEAGIRMQVDSIFRIASMTKPLVAAAALTLLDEGTLSLDDPVEKLLPELANRRVLRDPAGPLDATMPASRAIRIVDLLTHHSGLVSGVAAVDNPEWPRTPLIRAMIEADKARKIGPDAWLEAISTLPLGYEPGSQFSYAISFDVLGVLLARAAGMSLPEFMRTRLFEPLEMKDTAFQVTPEKQGRLAKVYGVDVRTKKISPMEDNLLSVLSPRTFPSGEGGLYSTASDYLQATQMLLGRGRRSDVRILSPRAVGLMTTNLLRLDERKEWAGNGFGLGIEIIESPDPHNAPSPVGGYSSVGSYGWPGAFGTAWVVDPKEDMVQLFMIQMRPNERALEIFNALQALTYAAIDD